MNAKQIIKLLESEELLNRVGYALHYNGWYKDSIEGKFGLKETGADHGRFRDSKNAKLDAEFFANIEFDENGMSVATDEHGNPYYKKVVKENGEVAYQVDSAIKGWDFLPPSWKQENLEAAKVVRLLLTRCYNMRKSISKQLGTISNIIHCEWVARQLSGKFGVTSYNAFYLGTLNKDDLAYIKNPNAPKPTEESELLKYFGREKLSGIWGIENFVGFNELPFEEQVKDTRQVLYTLKVVNKMTENQIDYFVDEEMAVEGKIAEQVRLDEQKKSNTPAGDGGM